MARRWIRPRRWSPPALDDRGATGPLRVRRLLPTGGHGPEDVVVDSDGQVITGLADGRIVRIDPRSGDRTVLAHTGGRPLGLHPRADGGVLVCDHDRGLLAVTPDGTVEVLVDTVGGEPLTFASNVVEGSGGTIWFTSSTTRWSLDDHLGDVFEHSGTGRLLRRDPDGAVTVLLDGLKFANGLALTADGTALLVAETAGYRIRRYGLDGTDTVFADNLPGFPDNLLLGGDGLLWAGIAAPRDPLLDRLLPLPGLLRLLVWNLPEAVRPKATPIAWVMAFDTDGRIVHDLRSGDGGYGFVTSAAERDGLLVAGSLTRPEIAVLEPPG
ncbi:strictosidine synthase family protein [Actinoplanes philippinensis]|uniref:Sugar lactone lactonase YvrE n=1 Tax=Actinoplanes philippinensis TaxID=35752 RepID=A0A1I2H0X2_9ACTN|nr:SMP-30/gluconolactonase/LRE family protein [Actinoplanes philippinensis]GIE78266.1 strictosidine synthase family protein [Actinoplanes philippinensis]SFF23033.1 Sugar lactone lactonase YvrE [Actinoplanes philippinensis]